MSRSIEMEGSRALRKELEKLGWETHLLRDKSEPDFIATHPVHRHFYCEVKHNSKRYGLTPEQKAEIGRLRGRGHRVLVYDRSSDGRPDHWAARWSKE